MADSIADCRHGQRADVSRSQEGRLYARYFGDDIMPCLYYRNAQRLQMVLSAERND